MKNVGEILTAARLNPVSVHPEDTAECALKTMALHNLGAIMILQNNQLLGIFSERDFARKILMAGKDPAKTPLTEVMTAQDLLTASSDHSAEECLSLMNRRGVRHLPVVDGVEVKGIVSILDVVSAVLEERDSMIFQLEKYVSETWPL